MDDTSLARCLDLVREARSQGGQAQSATLAELETLLAQANTLGAGKPDLSAQPALTLDLAGYVTGWNKGAEAMFGYSADEAVGRHALFLYADDEEDPGIAELFLEDGSSLIEVRRRKKSGETIWVRLALSLTLDEEGEPAGMLAYFSPLPRFLSEEDKVRLHARIIEDIDQGVLITDAHERIVSINNAFTRITGYSPEEAIGQTPDFLRSGVPDAEFCVRVHNAMHGQAPWRGEVFSRRKNGEVFPQSVTVSVVRTAGGAISHTFSLFSDISQHKDAEVRMQRMVNYDSLTGLPNRTLFNHLADQMLTEARRLKQFGAVMVIDVKRVGAISDTLGHDVAGELVCAISRMFRHTLRDADILARIGGTRFAVALPLVEKREHAAIVAHKLLAALSAPVAVGAHSLQVGAHIGIAIYLEDSTDTASLNRYADIALAKAEQGGGDGFLFYSEEMDARAKEHLRLESELRSALAARQLELHYQPKVSLRSGRIVGAEALIRWPHPQLGMVSPGVFIPLAEETGLIFEIGGWVLDEACRQIRAWSDAGLQAPPVAVNLSARQFNRRLPARILETLDRHRVKPQQIMLEITESLLVGGSDNIIAIMNDLVAMGLSLALDDFGTGYSSLAYLKKFPISTLKIDRAFVVGLPGDESDCAIARAIVTMGQQLRQEIVAEGVETVEQMAFLRELGCDQLQGYLFSPAVPPAEFARMMRDGERLLVGR
ncbi:MAG: EAL domain-containing protein [Massilia sp.]